MAMATVTSQVSDGVDTMTPLVVEEICSLLGRRRMSQAALARTLDKPPMWVSDRLTGKARLSVGDMALIAAGLQVRMVDLLPRSEREGVTPRYRPNRRDAMSLMPPNAPTSPYSGLHRPLPDKMALASVRRPDHARTADGRPSLVRPRGT